MLSVYKLARAIWRRIERHSWRAQHLKWLEPLKDTISRLTIQHASHDEIYDQTYCALVDESVAQTMSILAEAIVQHFKPRRVLDVGCGGGRLLRNLLDRGVDGLGLEYSSAALEMCRSRSVPVEMVNLELDDWNGPYGFDLVVTTEVGEHLPASSANGYVRLLCRAGNAILFTAAVPGTGGIDHVNEQPHSYWIEKFAIQGYFVDTGLSLRLRDEWQNRGALHYYFRNALVFRRKEAMCG
jgi:SAM-dependent methyltransferase